MNTRGTSRSWSLEESNSKREKITSRALIYAQFSAWLHLKLCLKLHKHLSLYLSWPFVLHKSTWKSCSIEKSLSEVLILILNAKYFLNLFLSKIWIFTFILSLLNFFVQFACIICTKFNQILNMPNICYVVKFAYFKANYTKCHKLFIITSLCTVDYSYNVKMRTNTPILPKFYYVKKYFAC